MALAAAALKKASLVVAVCVVLLHSSLGQQQPTPASRDCPYTGQQPPPSPTPVVPAPTPTPTLTPPPVPAPMPSSPAPVNNCSYTAIVTAPRDVISHAEPLAPLVSQTDRRATTSPPSTLATTAARAILALASRASTVAAASATAPATTATQAAAANGAATLLAAPTPFTNVA